MAYTVLDRVYSIFIDVMIGVSSGKGNAWMCRGITNRKQS